MGHQVAGADVQGSAVLTETLSQYSALMVMVMVMVMEKEYGEAYMQSLLKSELDTYLSNRGLEVLEELPLMPVENQDYIHY
jgi:ABC-2 type transport system permease protein